MHWTRRPFVVFTRFPAWKGLPTKGRFSRLFSSFVDENAVPTKNGNEESFTIRVVSYNVLSSQLSEPTYFTKCQTEHLDPPTRLQKITNKISNDIDNSMYPSIYCLQEVSRKWAGKLHVFFAQRNYQFIAGLYGHKGNGYMGIAVAYPGDRFETLDVDITRLSDVRVGGWPSLENEEDMDGQSLKRLWRRGGLVIRKKIIRHMVDPIRHFFQLAAKIPPISHWELAKSRHNVLVFIRFRQKLDNTENVTDNMTGEDGKTFCLSNYHMPCLYYAPKALTIHAEMAANRTQALAKGDPHIFAGDFNFTPTSSTYKLLTTGQMDKDDDAYPTKLYGMEWNASIQPMRSANAISEYGEPDLTNFSRVKDDDPFIDTLDYIFLSDGWEVINADRIKNRHDVSGPFPNEEEPSDHVMIGANLKLS